MEPFENSGTKIRPWLEIGDWENHYLIILLGRPLHDV